MSEDILLCSIAPYDIKLERSYALELKLKAADKTSGYSSVWLTGKRDYKRIYHDLKNIELIPIDITPEEIFKDLMANENLARQGCFIGTGRKTDPETKLVQAFPTSQEIAKGREARRTWLAKSVAEGDALFGKYGPRGIEQIPDYCKRAAVELDVSGGRPWLFTAPEAIQQCEGCGTKLATLKDGSSPAVCATCGAILDRAKALRLGIIKEEPQVVLDEDRVDQVNMQNFGKQKRA